MITGYDTSISKDAEREFNATLGATQNRPTFSRSELGAVLDTMSITQAYKNVNSQIKSVDNRGTYSLDTGNIYFQNRQSGKGGVYDARTRSIILGSGANVTTLYQQYAGLFLLTGLPPLTRSVLRGSAS